MKTRIPISSPATASTRRRSASIAVPATLAAFILATSSGLAVAQTSAAPAAQRVPQASTPHPMKHSIRASEMIGKTVSGADGNTVGEIRDLVINMKSGDVRYAMLEFDPGFFKSEKVFAVPLRDLTLAGDGNGLRYASVKREQLEKTAVSKADWQKALDNRRYVDGLDRNFGFSPPTGEARSIRATKLLGKDVDNRRGDGIGEIQDLVVDLDTGKVGYAVLAFDPSWFSRDKLYAFRLSSFVLASGRNDLVLDVDERRLRAMKNFDASHWGHLNDLNREDFVNAAPVAGS